MWIADQQWSTRPPPKKQDFLQHPPEMSLKFNQILQILLGCPTDRQCQSWKFKMNWSLLLTKWPGEFSLESHYCRLCWQKVQVPRICLKFGEPVGRATRWTGAKNGGSYALLLSLSSLVNFKTLEGAPSIHAHETVDIYIHYRILSHVYV